MADENQTPQDELDNNAPAAGGADADAEKVTGAADAEKATGAAEPTGAADADKASDGEKATESSSAGKSDKATDADKASESSSAGEDTPAEPVDPVEAKRAELAGLPGNWYVIHSYSGHERRVQTNLKQRVKTQNMEEQIFDVLVPMETVTELTKANKKKKVDRVRIPGYVLVRMEMNELSWRVVKDTPAVTGFVGDAQNPVPLSLDEVISMLAPMWQAEAAKAETEPTVVTAPAITFEVGESVIVTDGPFEAMPATVAAVDNTQRRLTLSIMIFERETPLEVTFDQVTKS